MNKHLLIVSQYFYPENFRINDMCFEWVKRGYKVTVITGIPNYPRGCFFKGYGLFRKRKEYIEGVNVVRLPIFPRGTSKLSLIANYLSFILSGWIWKIFTRIKADIVFNFEVSPMTQALPAVWYAKKKKIPFLIYVQDLWPENVEVIGKVTNKKVLEIINKIVVYIFQNSNKILVTSYGFKDNIIMKGIENNKIIFWPQYAEEFYKPIKIKRESGIFNIMYTGNIGFAQGLEILPILAKKLKENNMKNNIKFTLIGDGRNKTKLFSEINRYDVMDMFIFLGQKKAVDIPKLLSDADIVFLSFSDNSLFRMTVPAKLQSYLACGKPILGIVSGETERIIIESKAGLCSSPSNTDKAYKNIIKFYNMSKDEMKIMSDNATNYVNENYNKKDLMNQFDKIVTKEVNHV